MNAVLHPELSIAAFEAGEIDPERFDHEAHVHVGWLYTSSFELVEAIARFDAALKRLVAKLGAQGKYHATLTWFFLVLINERREADESWSAFRQRNSDLINSSKQILALYYSDERLFSERARTRFVLPDKGRCA